jgi:Protein of unknown function (DUF4232)
MRERVLIGVTIAAVALATAGCQAGNGTAGGSPPPVSPASSSPSIPSASPGSPAASGGTAEPTATATVAPVGDRCRSANLTVGPVRSGAAAGHVGYPVVVTNTGVAPCTLSGEQPVVLYTDPAGAIRVLPTRSEPREPDLTLRHGEQARMVLYLVNEYGGYDPSDPACAHPAVYRGLSIRLAGDDRLPVPGVELDVKCGDVYVYIWARTPTTS